MFSVRNYSSAEEYDIGKYLNFVVDVYDVVNSPFLTKLVQLPCVNYYEVSNGNEPIDKISDAVYGDPFFAFHIQFYNNITTDFVPEGTRLRLFNLEDLHDLCDSLYNNET